MKIEIDAMTVVDGQHYEKLRDLRCAAGTWAVVSGAVEIRPNNCIRPNERIHRDSYIAEAYFDSRYWTGLGFGQ